MNIYVWGTGFAAKELLEDDLRKIPIVGFIDKDAKEGQKMLGRAVYSPHEVARFDYDLIIVGTGHSQSVYDMAKSLGYDLDKFFFVYNNFFLRT